MTTTSSPLDPQDVAAHLDALRALARRLVRDGGVAEDVAQEAWLAAVGTSRRADVPLKWWLAGVVKNVARHVRRDEATRRRYEQATPPGRDAETPDALVERTELHHRLVGAVLALEEPYRATILMRYFEDLSAAEIARRAGVPAATVRSRLKRGLDMLRARLDGEHGGRRAWALAIAPLWWTGRARPTLAPHVAAVAAACLLLALGALALWRPWNAASAADADVAAVGAVKPVAGAAAPKGRAPNRARRGRTDVAAAAEDETPAPAPSPPPPAAEDDAGGGPTGLSIEVVDESGARVVEGTVKLDLGNVLQIADYGGDVIEKFFEHLGEKPLAGANPLVVRNLIKEMDGLEIDAFARVPGLPPTATTKVKIRAGRIEPIRLVATKPQSATVLVVDRGTDEPVANAAVVSVSELKRRGVEPASVRGTTAPGAAVTDASGRCTLAGLGRGTHEIEVDAKGYLRAKSKWTEGELRVAIEPQRGGGTVTATVLGPDGTGLPEIGVRLYGTDRVARTDAGGRVAFADVAPGFALLSIDAMDWGRARIARKWSRFGETPSAHGQLETGGTLNLELGFVSGTASLDGRLVDEDGAPIVGVAVAFTWGDGGVATDENGAVRFAGINAGSYPPRALLGPHELWFFEVSMIDVAEGQKLARTWTLGAATIRGRVVSGAEKTPVAGVDVHVGCAVHGMVRTDADGRFAMHRAPAGKYEISADAKGRAARRLGVAVPCDDEIVLEMVPCGRVAVRFAAADRPQLREAKIELWRASDGEAAGNFAMASGDDDLVSGDVLPDRYEVSVTVAGRTRRFPVEATSGATAVVEVRAP